MRELDWGHRNIRDLGNLPTHLSATGATIPGRIARGPRRELLTEDGWAAAISWGLRSIVDLRNEDEVGRRPSDPDAKPPARVSIVLSPTEDQSHPEFRTVCMPILDSPEYWQHNVRILPGLVRGTLQAVASSAPGVFVHCSAGRDRTGMLTALLLANAGVGAADVVADYAESVRAMAGTAAHGSPSHDRQASWTPAQVDTWLAGVEPHVRELVDDIDGVFARLELELDAREWLRAMLTEPELG